MCIKCSFTVAPHRVFRKKCYKIDRFNHSLKREFDAIII